MSLNYTQQDLLDLVHHRLGGRPDRRGWISAECPSCGKPAKRGQHFGYHAARGFKCFVCGYSGTLHRLALDLGLVESRSPVTLPSRTRRPPEAPRQAPPAWLPVADQLVAGTIAHPMRVELWQRYKPLRPETIERWKLGVGAVPGWERRGYCLTFPVYHKHGHLIGLRGRAQDGEQPKWVNAPGTGAYLFNLGGLGRGEILWICENMVDALLVMQAHESYDAAAPTTGVSTWREEWSEAIACAHYELVIVAYDNDLPGQAAGETRQQLLSAWRREHPGQKPPEANGAKVANSLLHAGVNVALYDWEEAPPKADLGWLLQKAAV